MDNYTDIREQIFHDRVRENIIFLLLFGVLYLVSFLILGLYRRKDREEYILYDDDDATVYKVSLYLCSFSFAVSAGAALLLPISIISNEVLLRYSDNLYVNWLNSSLIQGLWNHVFLFSNLSLFVFLPFSYLFTESEGFLWLRKGLWSRVQETFVVLCLVALMVLGMVYVISAIFGDSATRQVNNIWDYYLAFLYSIISLTGATLLLICTPVGIVRLLTRKPQFLRDLHEEFEVSRLEEESLRRRLAVAQASGKTYVAPAPMTPSKHIAHGDDARQRLFCLQNGALQMGLSQTLSDAAQQSKRLDLQRHMGMFYQNFVSPICTLLVAALSIVTVFMVVCNMLELLVGVKALPLSTQELTLGINSFSRLGSLGAAIEIILIVYLQATSVYGLYAFRAFAAIEPKVGKTPLSHLIANCAVLLILSSALPLTARTLGITNFDLLGDFGQIHWLGDFQLVFFYNIAFGSAVTLCLVNKFTSKVRRELYNRLIGFLTTLFDWTRVQNVTVSPSSSVFKHE